MTSTGIRNRPRHRGVPVPYIASWSHEELDRVSHTFTRDNSEGWRIGYPDEVAQDRDQLGVLWARHPSSNTQDGGHPMMGSVHAHRQRECMHDGRCQVCGEVQSPPYLWLLPDVEAPDDPSATIRTPTPPVCTPCARAAVSLCPALGRGGFHLYRVERYFRYGVYGTYFARPGGMMAEPRLALARDGSPFVNLMVADQLVVELVHPDPVDLGSLM